MRSPELCSDMFVPAEEAIEDLNRSLLPTDMSPLRQPSVVRSRDRPAYVKRKQTELEQVAVKNVRSRLRIAYDRDAPSGSSEPTCSTCTEWVDNLRQAFETATSLRERCQLLTLLPSTLTNNEVQKMIPQASMYLISKSRKLKEHYGVWYEPDPYTRCKVSPENVSAALEYFTKDELQCSRQRLCLQGDCDHCPKGQSLTIQELDIPEDEEIVLATWESGDL
ncbi:hypothetical protein HPB47_009312, partial [Ixodes persulcatus]